ncbi:hypothetical protein ACO0SA_000650 [Hanseniaspora valbyensis]
MINLSGIVSFPKIFLQPKLIVPKMVCTNFNEINFEQLKKTHGIKCIVLDKDNCISKDKTDRIYPQYLQNNWINGLLKWYDMDNIAVVSNSIGSSDDTIDFRDAKEFQKNYKQDMQNLEEKGKQHKDINIILHNKKKPGCQEEILDYFIKEKKLCDHPSEIAIIGDRLLTDVLMGNMMKAFPVYLQTGVHLNEKNVLIKLEQILYNNYIKK